MRSEAKKLDQLTSLRFFAAMMIVVLHARSVFGYEVEFVLGQGVSFFYVLSGFILYYVYPRLESGAQVRRFLRARIARIWPAYLASFLLGLWLVGYAWNPLTALAHVAMVQAWIPLTDYFYSYNPVAWSVSTELFFYLAFPLLLWRWEATWKVKLLACLVPIVVLVVACARFGVLPYAAPGGPDGMAVTQQGLLYIHPVARLFEFVLGMAIGLAWRRTQAGWSTATATALELATIALCALAMYAMYRTLYWVALVGEPAAMWLTQSGGSALAFAALIHVMAQGRGLVSHWLTHRVPVLLGEISFSIYLLHYILLDYIRANADLFPAVPQPLRFAIFLAILLLASFLTWKIVELPGRRLLLGRANIHGSAVLTRTWREHAAVGRGAVAAAVALGALVALVHFTKLEPATAAPVDIASEGMRQPAPASCNVETANQAWLAPGPLRLPRGDVVVEGWFLSEASKRTGVPATLRVLDAAGAGWEFPVTDWIPRPQVLAVMGGVDTGNAGFRQRFDMGGIAPGRYRLALAFADGGTAYLCDKDAWLELE